MRVFVCVLVCPLACAWTSMQRDMATLCNNNSLMITARQQRLTKKFSRECVAKLTHANDISYILTSNNKQMVSATHITNDLINSKHPRT